MVVQLQNILPASHKLKKPQKSKYKICKRHETIKCHHWGHFTREITLWVSPNSPACNLQSLELWITEHKIEVVHPCFVYRYNLCDHASFFISTTKKCLNPFWPVRIIRIWLYNYFTNFAGLLFIELRSAAYCIRMQVRTTNLASVLDLNNNSLN
ncbi:Os03g0334951 [Oryza sativa Japonica Group]|uniref:Os03g0334951 protein n=1 Tax=Oryza sativa subsp. japonica TaxID=39947 RepID=A0A0N7KH80_ORYSJ|nr:hypothetical protein EE612_017246 [Oryza sativa]BAS84073.1 Os03g0334951 [Oryza sativa Japonica Group]